MNSKFLLLIALLLVLLPAQSSLGSDRKKMIIPVTDRATTNQAVEKQIAAHPIFELVKFELPQELNKTHQPQPADEDGKTHYYHFSRLDKRRWRRVYCILAKIVLLVAHVCFLICSYHHLTT